ncbi:MAG: DNA polymerase IV, partial [Chloroflexi bacterium]|nr:DNA polymerase IV [Chloroflexota bacterium]
LHAAMPRMTASRLCPQAIFIEGNFARYRDASRKFMAILADFSPFLEPLGLDEAYLDATGFESLHGTIRKMAEAIKKRIEDELSICASIGIAANRTVAKIASDLSKPDGLLEVPVGKERSFLEPLPVGKLPGIGQKSQQVLLGLGIRTLGQLADLSPDILKSRFGAYGQVIHDHANGIGSSKVAPPGAAKSISRETTFATDTRDVSQLKATLRYLSERVGSDLRRQGRLAKCLTLKLRFADFTTTTRQRTLRQGSDSDRVIFDTGEGLLKNELAREKQAVRLIGIGVSGLGEIGRQLDMLDSSAPRMVKLNATIDRIRDKYGFSAIQTGATLRLKDLFPKDKHEEAPKMRGVGG